MVAGKIKESKTKLILLLTFLIPAIETMALPPLASIPQIEPYPKEAVKLDFRSPKVKEPYGTAKPKLPTQPEVPNKKPTAPFTFLLTSKEYFEVKIMGEPSQEVITPTPKLSAKPY